MRRLPTVPIMLAGFAAFLDLYATQPLLPLLARTFHASHFAVGLTVTAPTIAVAAAAPAIGRLADRIGLRKVIVGSAFALGITTVLAATSSSLAQLVGWRFLQGLITPGVLSDFVGLFLLIPWSRRLIAQLLRRSIERRIADGRLRVFTFGGQQPPPPNQPPFERPSGPIIDVKE